VLGLVGRMECGCAMMFMNPSRLSWIASIRAGLSAAPRATWHRLQHQKT
jgi:hypothetical protein